MPEEEYRINIVHLSSDKLVETNVLTDKETQEVLMLMGQLMRKRNSAAGLEKEYGPV